MVLISTYKRDVISQIIELIANPIYTKDAITIIEIAITPGLIDLGRYLRLR